MTFPHKTVHFESEFSGTWTQASKLFKIQDEQDYAYPSCLMYG